MNEQDDRTMKCLKNPEYFKLPGQKCNDAALCQGTVRDGYCRGKALGDKCEQHIECDVGLRCGQDLVCENAGVDGSDCDDLHRRCSSYLYCQENVCTKYGSIADDSPAGKGGEDLCASKHVDKHGVCKPGPKLLGPIFVDTNEHKCVYDNGDEDYAVCGFHAEGKAICKPGDGELMSDWQAVSLSFRSPYPVAPYIPRPQASMPRGNRPYVTMRYR